MAPSSKRGQSSKSNSRVFIVSQYVDSVQNSTGYYWRKIIEELSLRPDRIYVICPKDSYAKIDRVSDSVTYIFVNNFSFSKDKWITRLIGQIALSFYFTWAVFKNVRKQDVVFSGTNPALVLVFMAMLKVIRGFKWLLLVHDVFPENLRASKVIGGANILYRPAKYLFDRVYSTPEILIAIGRDMLDLLSEKTMRKKRIEYIPNWVDPKDILPISRKASHPVTNKGFSNRRIVFQFFGNLGRLQGIQNLLSAISLVKDEKAVFIFIGGGSEEPLISSYIISNPNKNITHLPGVPFGRNNEVLSSCDVAIVSLSIGMNGLAVPSKAYFSLAADKPLLVVTAHGSELHRLIAEEKLIGWFCEAGNPVKLASLIDSICNENHLNVHGKPREILMNKYDKKTAIEKYSTLISELMMMR